MKNFGLSSNPLAAGAAALLGLFAAGCPYGSGGAITNACVKERATGSRCIEGEAQAECADADDDFRAGSSCADAGFENHCAGDVRTWYASSDCGGACSGECTAADPAGSGAGSGGSAGGNADAGAGPGESDPAQSGPCSSGELFSREHFSGPELFCHRIDNPPVGLFYTENFCLEIAADGTGRVDWAGGYSPSARFVEDGHERSDDIEEFEWGALMDGSGEFVRDPLYDALQLFWHEPGSETAVDAQVPFLLWNETGGTFENVWPEIVAEPEEQRITSAACMFAEPRCITREREEYCFAEGYLHGPYERLNYYGLVEEQGEYTQGERSGTWTRYLYQNGETLTGREERDYAGSEDDYAYRKYEQDVLVEEGSFAGGVRHGPFKYYYGPDSPTDSRPLRAAGLLQSEGSYDQNERVGEWTTYTLRYDIDPPDSSEPDFGVALEAWYAERQAIAVCEKTWDDYASGARTTYVYGDPGCPSGICNPGLAMIISVPPGGGDSSCTDPGGAPVDCPSTVCR